MDSLDFDRLHPCPRVAVEPEFFFEGSTLLYVLIFFPSSDYPDLTCGMVSLPSVSDTMKDNIGCLPPHLSDYLFKADNIKFEEDDYISKRDAKLLMGFLRNFNLICSFKFVIPKQECIHHVVTYYGEVVIDKCIDTYLEYKMLEEEEEDEEVYVKKFEKEEEEDLAEEKKEVCRKRKATGEIIITKVAKKSKKEEEEDEEEDYLSEEF